MKKLLAAIYVLGLVGSASAQEVVKNGSDSFGALAGVNNFRPSDSESFTGYSIGINYTKFLGNNIFVQPSFQYVTASESDNDKQVFASVDLGYAFKLENNITFSPKAGLGLQHTFGNEVNTRRFINVGVEVGFANNWTVVLDRKRLNGDAGTHADITSLSLGYRF